MLTRRPHRRVGSRATALNAEKKKEKLSALLASVKAKVRNSSSHATPHKGVDAEATNPQESNSRMVGKDDYFLLRFYEHCSFVPRKVVDLTGFAPEIVSSFEAHRSASAKCRPHSLLALLGPRDSPTY